MTRRLAETIPEGGGWVPERKTVGVIRDEYGQGPTLTRRLADESRFAGSEEG